MKRSHRRIHLGVWLVLAVVVPAILVAGFVAMASTQGARPTASSSEAR